MFGETAPRVEAHVLDFSGDLTDTEITVELVSKIRDTQDFENNQDLIKQITLDIMNIRACLQE